MGRESRREKVVEEVLEEMMEEGRDESGLSDIVNEEVGWSLNQSLEEDDGEWLALF